MTHHMLGKVLYRRYQIVQSLGAGVFGQTYIAVDIDHPENPKCVIKQLKVTNFHPSHLETLRLRFLTETQTLKQLGHHNQIPQLIACFEENERFYLVQEFIEGHALTAELPTKHKLSYFWSEDEVIKFLSDVLSILDFVHSNGVIHCDVKPENLIRRASDGKIVLIDFGSIQPVDFGTDTVLPIYRIPVTSLGYIPPEQFIGQTQLSSDIYALGMIAIQALTGLTPLQLQVDPRSNEIVWRTQETQVSDYLAAIISQMIRYNHKNRFQTAASVYQALQRIPKNAHPYTVEAEYTVIETVDELPKTNPKTDSQEKKNTSPLLTGVKVGLAANSLVLGFGVYSLIHNNTPAPSETETLYKATEDFQSGDLNGAIARVKSIPSTSNVYPEAQATIEEWQHQWQIAAEQYKTAENAVSEGRWSDVLKVAPIVPDILYWQSKTDRLVAQANRHIEVTSKTLLAKAYERAGAKDFNTALDYLEQIPKNSTNTVVEQKIAEYTQKRHVRAAYLLQQAYQKATNQEFEVAVKYLKQIPEDTSVYATAQAKLIEYTHKQRVFAESEVAMSTQVINLNRNQTSTKKLDNTNDSFINGASVTRLQDLQPGDLMREINIR
ncbi:serine/threonine protein kinase [Calothrix sp. NIES-4071]|nr:serine/threonine protein kinase [Calothrix sp. NIES-4071]BAZ61718.1 serine/threonine protein kinase [Calothrix sp. NIES-4105]